MIYTRFISTIDHSNHQSLNSLQVAPRFFSVVHDAETAYLMLDSTVGFGGVFHSRVHGDLVLLEQASFGDL